MRIFLLVAFLLAGYAQLLSAHTGTVAGKITDANTKQPLIGATITIEGTKLGAISDTNGSFAITNAATGTYQLHSIARGYKEQTQTIMISLTDTLRVAIELSVDVFSLNPVTISADRSYSAASSSTISTIDFDLKPRQSAQDMLRLVPGLFLAQHAGGGKAEQIFLRGFDNDHGTDINISVDGLPVNMVSHGHGQGYADLHWLIPEVVQGMESYKGAYSAEYGDLATSGAVRFITKDQIDNNIMDIEGGEFGTARYMTMLKMPFSNNRISSYVAGEFYHTDGYFDNPADFNRYNVFGKSLFHIGDNSTLDLWVSGFASGWNASGQIPERAVAEGLIDRFGSIDPSEGGTTQRQNISLTFDNNKDGTDFLTQVYFTNYGFKLFSNFTFFLVDSVHGDEIEQDDQRIMAGFRSEYSFNGQLGDIATNTLFGTAFRADDINTQLWHDEKRVRLSNTVNVVDHQEDMSFYSQEEFQFSPEFRVQGGLRGDYLIYNLNDLNPDTGSANLSGFVQQAILNPKLNVVFTPVSNLDIYLNGGSGFHSNDARVVVTNPSANTLARAVEEELGIRTLLFERLNLTASLWASHLESELVYDADNGTYNPAGASQRYGVDVGARWQLIRVLFADVDVNYAHGRFVDSAAGHNYLPLAPVLTSTGGLTYRDESGLEGSLRYRYMSTRPANSTNTVQTQPYIVFDATIAYKMERYKIGLTIENLFNTAWDEAQFDTVTRLKGESSPVENLDFTPGTPFNARLALNYFF